MTKLDTSVRCKYFLARYLFVRFYETDDFAKSHRIKTVVKCCDVKINKAMKQVFRLWISSIFCLNANFTKGRLIKYKYGWESPFIKEPGSTQAHTGFRSLTIYRRLS